MAYHCAVVVFLTRLRWPYDGHINLCSFFFFLSFFIQVILILAADVTSREIMLAAHALGYTSGEYVFFLVTNPDSEDVTMDVWKRNDGEDEVLLHLSRSA